MRGGVCVIDEFWDYEKKICFLDSQEKENP